MVGIVPDEFQRNFLYILKANRSNFSLREKEKKKERKKERKRKKRKKERERKKKLQKEKKGLLYRILNLPRPPRPVLV